MRAGGWPSTGVRSCRSARDGSLGDRVGAPDPYGRRLRDHQKLAGQVEALFRGETLRGLLLYAWGWSVVSTIALYAAIAAAVGFVVMLIVTIGDFVADPRLAAEQR